MLLTDLKTLITYLRNCVESWVDHDLLAVEFSEQEIWEAMRRGYLVPREEYHTYDINAHWDPSLKTRV